MNIWIKATLIALAIVAGLMAIVVLFMWQPAIIAGALVIGFFYGLVVTVKAWIE